MKKCILISMLLFSGTHLLFAMDPDAIFEDRPERPSEELPQNNTPKQRESGNNVGRNSVLQRIRTSVSDLFEEKSSATLPEEEMPKKETAKIQETKFENLLRRSSCDYTSLYSAISKYKTLQLTLQKSRFKFEEADFAGIDPENCCQKLDREIVLQEWLLRFKYPIDDLTESEKNQLIDARIRKITRDSYESASVRLTQLLEEKTNELKKTALLAAYQARLHDMDREHLEAEWNGKLNNPQEKCLSGEAIAENKDSERCIIS